MPFEVVVGGVFVFVLLVCVAAVFGDSAKDRTPTAVKYYEINKD